MKLKYNFVTRNVDGRPVAVAVGKDNAYFNGMIKLNDTGSFIFKMLSENTTVDEIAASLASAYDVSTEDALADVKTFVEGLRAGGLLEE